jgi:MATE family multidrug resistance protein
VARRVAWLGLGVTALIATGSAVLLWLARGTIVGWYGPAPDVALLAAALLSLVALYHLADALQSVSLFVLRCYGVTLQPLLIYCVLLWGVGLFGGYRLAYHGLGPLPAMHSPAAFWSAGGGALIVVAALLLLLVWRHSRAPGHARVESSMA